MQVKKQLLELDMEQRTGSKLGQEFDKAVYCHPAHFFPRRNINNLRCAHDSTLMAESEEELKSLLTRVNEESEKAGLKLYTQKTKIMAPGPIISWQIDWETM